MDRPSPAASEFRVTNATGRSEDRPQDRPRPDLSPSAARSVRGLLAGRGATWREALDGSAVGVGAGLVSAVALLRLVRRRRS